MNSVAWVLILLCTANFLSSFGHEDSELLKSKDFLISSNKLSLSDLEHPESEKYNATEKAQRGRGAPGGGSLVHRRPAKRSVMESENNNVMKKAQRGNGVYGGANDVHRRPAKSAAPSSTIFGFSFFLGLQVYYSIGL